MGKNHLEDVGVDSKIILKLILKKYRVRTRPEFISLRTQTSGGLL
jgi:hypothetical protein